jgi:hypothetical protein
MYVQGCNRKFYDTVVLSFCTHKKGSCVLLTLTVLYVQQKTFVCQYHKRKTMSSYVRLIATQSDLRRYVCTMFYLSSESVAVLIPSSLQRSGQWNPRFTEIVIFFSVSPWRVTSWPRIPGLWTTTSNSGNSNEDILLLVGWHEVMRLGAETTLTPVECVVAKLAENYVRHSDDKLNDKWLNRRFTLALHQMFTENRCYSLKCLRRCNRW